MEMYNYRCPVCGYVHQVPSYWMGYAPEETHEQMHFSLKTGEVCSSQRLEYAGESEEQ